MDVIVKAAGWLAGTFWGVPGLVLLLGTGVYYTFAFKFAYWRNWGFHFKNTFGTMFGKADDIEGEGTVRGFAAACTAIASTIGVGNVAGVATAITAGGPGAVFWMWMSAAVGMSTKAAEIICGQRYRVKFETLDEYLCGRNYVMKNGLNLEWLAKIIAITIITDPISLMVQGNAVATSFEQAFNLNVQIGLYFVAASLAVVIIGGVRRIAGVADKVVPFMASIYILSGIVLVLTNVSAVGSAFAIIVKGAFTPLAAAGGFGGSTLKSAARFGVARGVYSNESGMGGGMMAHAAAIVDHPVRQASWGWGENFIDTLLVCSITALANISTGVWLNTDGITGAAMTTMAYRTTFGQFGAAFMAISVALFAWTTLLSAYYGAEKAINFYFGDTALNGIMMKIYMVWYLLPMCIWGSLDTGNLWVITDTLTIIAICATLGCLIALRKVVVGLHNDFYDRYLPALEAGENPPNVSFVTKP